MMTSLLAPLLVAATMTTAGAPLAADLEAAVRARAGLTAEATVVVTDIVPADAGLLKRAARRVSVELPPGEDGVGPITARVHLEVPGSPGAWTWVRARVTVSVPTIVSARALARDAVLTPDDVRVEARPLRRGQLDATAPVLGMVLRRAVRPGEPLQTGWLKAPTAVERGDRVRAVVSSPGLRVRTAAESLASGAISEVIRVKLLASGRVVRAVIRGPREVEVTP